MTNLEAAKEKFEGKSVVMAPGCMKANTAKDGHWYREFGYRQFDRFVCVEVIAYRDSDNDLLACVCPTVSGCGIAGTAVWFNLDYLTLD